jgi:hypothetical protein
MTDSHPHIGKISSRQLWAVTGLTFVFCLGEAVVGYLSNSLALMADAGHNFADALALALFFDFEMLRIFASERYLTAPEILDLLKPVNTVICSNDKTILNSLNPHDRLTTAQRTFDVFPGRDIRQRLSINSFSIEK